MHSLSHMLSSCCVLTAANCGVSMMLLRATGCGSSPVIFAIGPYSLEGQSWLPLTGSHSHSVTLLYSRIDFLRTKTKTDTYQESNADTKTHPYTVIKLPIDSSLARGKKFSEYSAYQFVAITLECCLAKNCALCIQCSNPRWGKTGIHLNKVIYVHLRLYESTYMI